MGWFRPDATDKRAPSDTVTRRARALRDGDLVTWHETLTMNEATSIALYTTSGDVTYLDEAVACNEAAFAVLTELVSRHGALTPTG